MTIFKKKQVVILAVALWLQEEHAVAELFDRLEALSVAYQDERAELEAGADATRLVLRCLLVMADECEGDLIIFDATQVAERVNRLAREIGIVGPSDKFTNEKKVGHVLKKLRFRKTTPTRTRRRRQGTREEIESLAKAYGVSLANVENVENVDAN